MTRYPSWWIRFWHEPILAQRLGLFRIVFGLTIFTDQCIQFLPYFSYLYGPHGASPPAGDLTVMSSSWAWSGLVPAYFIDTSDWTVIRVIFGIWVLVTWLFIFGIKTRVMTVLLWLLTAVVLGRNPAIRNAGDHVLQNALFVLMFASCGEAFSWDAASKKYDQWRTQSPWAVRLLQMLLCTLYTGSALSKLHGGYFGTWIQGTTLFYVFNDFGLTRWPYVEFPVPTGVLVILTYASLLWELFFIPLVIYRRTRKWALIFGVLFHLNIYLIVEVGWFSWYSIAMYTVWIPDEWLRTKGLRYRELLGQRLGSLRARVLGPRAA
jgi:hypothetical protein